MIDEKIILQELDGMIKIQQKSVEQAEQESSNEAVVYMRVRNMIKEKCTSEAATPEGADINSLTQVHYSTESEKEQ